LGTDSSRIFSTAVQKEIWTPQTIIRTHDPGEYRTHFNAYGLGFFLRDIDGYQEISHTGGLEGMVTQIVMYPELKLGIIVLTNQQEPSAFIAISNQIRDGYLGLPAADWIKVMVLKNTTSKMEAKKVADSITVELQKSYKIGNNINFSAYSGIYQDPWLGKVNISDKNGKFFFKSYRSPKLYGELFPYKENSFVVKWQDRSMDADAFVIFRLNENGIAEGMKMKAISPLTDFSYDFQDLDFSRISDTLK
jgi:hypothetical protein